MATALHHLPLHGPTYLTAARLQTHLINTHILSKTTPTNPPPPPPPTILTTTFPPTYTLGRRDRHTLTPALLTRLSPAAVHATLRGGQTTFHGPGQLVAYPILDLRTHSLSPRCYVHLLESTTIALLRSYGLTAADRDAANPGVYVGGRKIASLGVRVRRGVTGHGVAVNVGMEMGWWGRIEACGIRGMEMTDMRGEGVEADVTEVGERWVGLFADALKLEVEKRGLRGDEKVAMETPVEGEETVL